LEICINVGKYTKTLCEIELKDIRSDEALFARIRKDYFRIRTHRSTFWLLKPSGVHFVKAIKDSKRAYILQQPSMPPPEEVDSKRYIYEPCPLPDDSPIPTNPFLHALTCGSQQSDSSSDAEPAWLPRLPKKSSPSIFLFDTPINEGWSIHITEGPDWAVIVWLNVSMIVVSGIAALLWSLFRKDFSGAFGFAAWILMAANAVLLVYIAKWNRS
ncbi:hypothetical protein N431DRAFT_304534, partial [Stipitochalara longipes BDJ]